ncbi:MAG: hypothetical protein KTR24_03475 [Saprospiraceae bacterium]|nr:hypothetical protein [Saprospiraceae bacterium]
MSIQHHSQIDDSDFEHQFASGGLSPSLFDHEAHLRLAWIHVRRYGRDQAVVNITAQLKAYVRRLGASDKYHETLTIASIAAVHHFMRRSDAGSFNALLLEFPQLKYDFKSLIASHYSHNIFECSEARAIYQEPDLQPF